MTDGWAELSCSDRELLFSRLNRLGIYLFPYTAIEHRHLSSRRNRDSSQVTKKTAEYFGSI